MNYELFRIKWVDSCGHDGWIEKEEAVHRDLIIESVGFLISEGSDSVLMSSHVAQNYFHSTMEIPKKSIISMECIKS